MADEVRTMKQMRNSSRKAYPKRNASVTDPKPKYGGKMLWGMADRRIKCIDCTHYATHECVIKHDPNPFDPSVTATVQYCVKHANKAVGSGIVLTINPFEEYRAHQRDVKKWESRQGGELQGVLV